MFKLIVTTCIATAFVSTLRQVHAEGYVGGPGSGFEGTGTGLGSRLGSGLEGTGAGFGSGSGGGFGGFAQGFETGPGDGHRRVQTRFGAEFGEMSQQGMVGVGNYQGAFSGSNHHGGGGGYQGILGGGQQGEFGRSGQGHFGGRQGGFASSQVGVQTPSYEDIFISNLDEQCIRRLCAVTNPCNYTISGTNSELAYENCATSVVCVIKVVKEHIAQFGMDCNNDGVTNCEDYLMLNFGRESNFARRVTSNLEVHQRTRYTGCRNTI